MAMRSADLMLMKALSDPSFVQQVQADPKATLEKFKNEAIVATLPAPTGKLAGAIWLIIVGAFTFVLVAAAVMLFDGLNTTLDSNATYAVKFETILTLFTTSAAFLAGLLSPSPIRNSDGQ